MTAISLTPAQRTALKGLAHGLPVTVHVGQGGVSPALLKEVDVALTAHGLIKVRILAAERDAREEMMAALAEALFCSPVQHIGRVVVLWRARPEDAMPAATAAKGAATGDKAAGNRRQLAVRDEGARMRAGATRTGSTRSRGEGFEQRDRRPRPPSAATPAAAPGRARRTASAMSDPRRAPGGERGRRPAADEFAERPRAPRRSEGDVFASDVPRGPRAPRRGEAEGFSADRARPPRRTEEPASTERSRRPRAAEAPGAEHARAPRPGFGNAFGARRPSTPRRDGPARTGAPRAAGPGARSGPTGTPRGADRPRGPRKPTRD